MKSPSVAREERRQGGLGNHLAVTKGTFGTQNYLSRETLLTILSSEQPSAQEPAAEESIIFPRERLYLLKQKLLNMPARPRSPVRPSPADISPISVNEEESSFPFKTSGQTEIDDNEMEDIQMDKGNGRAKIDDHSTTAEVDRKSASTNPVHGTALPSTQTRNIANLSAQVPTTGSYAMPPRNMNASGFINPIASNPNLQGSTQSAAMMGTSRVGPLITNVDAFIEDIMTCGLHFMSQLRNRDDLGVDPAVRQLLLDPLPRWQKPVMFADAINIPPEIYKYFYLLTFHVNKVMATAYIWMDLYCNCDIYISWNTICKIQQDLFRDGREALGWAHGLPMYQQTPEVQHYVLGLMASTKMLEMWGKTSDGIKWRKEMEELLEGKETSDLTTGERMLRRVDFPSWRDALDSNGTWLMIINQRFQ
ncbi:uncharacterized protein HMPREF1541_01799 [Cyphellophora europaea CBS 101466]|uniref:Uncharacterized protein n=1 Tax=Cyphellophora europaea (strain CBS 101466) TaxID=1220924 RepID=W2S1S8_CYPE1|nr:uncharacterized protein HMPREF1541_01799 [Cyphellophora europaea CBS 101466]ETN42642.1 hypothetical protein HMPREF1541_01799 [Cyphellophora europaea CBS 101466]